MADDKRAAQDRWLARLAALSAAIAIMAAAFGAHEAASARAADWLHLGGMYQLVHGVAILALLALGTRRTPLVLLLLGSAIFAFTLYAMAIGAPLWLGAITPIGGTLMIVGWLWLALTLRPARHDQP